MNEAVKPEVAGRAAPTAPVAPTPDTPPKQPTPRLDAEPDRADRPR